MILTIKLSFLSQFFSIKQWKVSVIEYYEISIIIAEPAKPK